MHTRTSINSEHEHVVQNTDSGQKYLKTAHDGLGEVRTRRERGTQFCACFDEISLLTNTQGLWSQSDWV